MSKTDVRDQVEIDYADFLKEYREALRGRTIPHCDELVLHPASECNYCADRPDLFLLRGKHKVYCTGVGKGYLTDSWRECPSTVIRPLEKIERWYGNVPETAERAAEREADFQDIKPQPFELGALHLDGFTVDLDWSCGSYSAWVGCREIAKNFPDRQSTINAIRAHEPGAIRAMVEGTSGPITSAVPGRRLSEFIKDAEDQLGLDVAKEVRITELTPNDGPFFDPVTGNYLATEVRVTDPETGGQKGSKLAQLGAVDPNALLDVAKVAGFGAGKYDTFNFAKGYKWSLSFNALMRHLLAFWAGEDADPESGLPHLAHAAWHCLALLTFTRFKRGTDDRFPLRSE